MDRLTRNDVDPRIAGLEREVAAMRARLVAVERRARVTGVAALTLLAGLFALVRWVVLDQRREPVRSGRPRAPRSAAETSPTPRGSTIGPPPACSSRTDPVRA